MKTTASASLASCFAALSISAAEPVDAFPRQPPVPYLSVEESLKRFQIQDGYRLEPVLTEPAIKKPVAISFTDGLFWSIHEMQLLQPPMPLAAKPAAKKPVNAFQ